MPQKQLVLVIIGALILVGLASGFGYQLGQKSVGATPENQLPTVLESKVTQKWSGLAVGVVTEISGRNLTLTKNGDSLTIPVLETAKIYFAISEELEKKPESISFEEIKVGDEVNVGIATIENDLVGETVTILVPQ